LWGRLEVIRDNPRVLEIREQARRSAAVGRGRQLRWQFAAAMTAALLAAVGAWWALRSTTNPQTRDSVTAGLPARVAPPALVHDAVTGIGQRSVLLLADGSKVTLNTASAVHSDYTGAERRVTLIRGEAFFDVARDRTRPFVVQAGSRHVIAVGTAFDVRMQGPQTKVTLVEGKVRVVRDDGATVPGTTSSAREPAVMLEAGSALLSREGGADQVERLDALRATSWTTGKLIFDGERLADVVAEMNRYSRERIVISDPRLSERRVSGVFQPTSGPAFAKALEEYGIAHVGRQTATEIDLEFSR
ncbi:MAG: FecR family protein, partial [Terriglobales bacterium]